MKNIMKLIGIITLAMIIGFSMTACGTTGTGTTGTGATETNTTAPSGPGTLTITGLDQFEGYYVSAAGPGEGEKSLSAASEVGPGGNQLGPTVTGGIIENGSVSLQVWEWLEESVETCMETELTTYTFDIAPYNGSDNVNFSVIIWEGSQTYHWQSSNMMANAYVSATFTNGVATGEISFEAPQDEGGER